MPDQTHKNRKKGVSTFDVYQHAENFDVYQYEKKSTSSLTSFLRYCKDIACCYFEYFRHAWLHPSNMTVPTFLIL